MSINYDSYPSKKISETFSKINSICIVIFFFKFEAETDIYHEFHQHFSVFSPLF